MGKHHFDVIVSARPAGSPSGGWPQDHGDFVPAFILDSSNREPAREPEGDDAVLRGTRFELNLRPAFKTVVGMDATSRLYASALAVISLVAGWLPANSGWGRNTRYR